MDRILAPRVRIAPASGEPHTGGIVSWPVTLSATIGDLDNPDCHDAVQEHISDWISERYGLQIAPGISLQKIYDDQAVVSAKFATKAERGWSVRCKVGTVAFDATLITAQGQTRLSLDVSSDLVGSDKVDIFHHLSSKFVVARDGVQLHARPQLASIKTMPRLIEFIEDTDRKLPVVIVSLDENERRIANAAVDPFKLSKRLIGVAHVIIVPGDETYLLSIR